jgi:hypothetical protein
MTRIALLLLLSLAACKQGLGDRCQVNSDCVSGLVCSAATGTCTDQTSGGIDAQVPDAKAIDAPKLDAAKLDADKMDAAKMDAPIDAAGG